MTGNPHHLPLWCTHSVCTDTDNANSFPNPYVVVRVKGQPSTNPTPLRLQLRGSIESHELTLSAVYQTCLKLRPVNETFETSPTIIDTITNTSPHAPSTSLPVCHTTLLLLSSVFIPSFSILVMLSVRARLCHSCRGLLSTGGAQLSSLCVLLFVFV